MQEGKFHRIADQLDLAGKSADVVVVDIGHFFEDQFLDLGLGDLLEDEAAALIQQE